MDINSWRKRIDDLDRQMVKLLNERARIVQEIGSLKRSTNLPIREPEREAVVLENVARANAGPLTSAELQNIYNHIMEAMRGVQAAGEEARHRATA